MAELKKYLDTTALGTLVDQIKAEDAKTLAAAKKYTDDAGSLYDAAGAASTAESNAKAYTDALENGQVKLNKEAIAKLNGTGEGSVAKAIADAKALIDADVDAVERKADKNATDIAAINNAETGILKKAKDYADGEVAEVQGAVDALALYVGTIPSGATSTNVVAYVQEKTTGIATDAALQELTGRVAQAETDIDNIEKDYLKAADKTELDGKITNVQTAVDTEKSRAEGAEGGLSTRIKAIEDDYLKASDKTELQGNIDSVSTAIERLTNGVSADEIDGVNDLIKYVKEHGPEVVGMQEDIAQNASDISGVAGRMTTAEGKITTLEGAVATKAEKEYVDGQVSALQGADTGLGNRITALENKFGGAEGSVEDQIADAKQEAIDAAATAADKKDEAILAAAKKYADDEDAKIETRVDALETASAKHALASDLTTLDGRVTTAEGYLETLQGEIDSVSELAAANKSAHEANAGAIALKASQADLEAAVGRIAKNEGDISTLNGTVAEKADADDLDDAIERIAKNEGDISALTSAINSFTAITPEEVNALFA